MTKQLDPSANQADASVDAQRERLRSKVAHAAEILHEQGPISTFIHTNPLHSLEHLHLQKLFDNMWLHLIVLDIHIGAFTRYLPAGKWSTIPTEQPAVLA